MNAKDTMDWIYSRLKMIFGMDYDTDKLIIRIPFLTYTIIIHVESNNNG